MVAFVQDSDADGVPDNKDRCANSDTTLGVVDNNGCECGQKTQADCLTVYGWDGGSPCCLLPQGAVNLQAGCQVSQTSGAFKSSCCFVDTSTGTGTTCLTGTFDNPLVYYDSQVTVAPTGSGTGPCPQVSSVSPDAVMSLCCPEPVSLSPKPVHGGNIARFFLGCAFMGISRTDLPVIAPQQTYGSATYNLGDEPSVPIQSQPYSAVGSGNPIQSQSTIQALCAIPYLCPTMESYGLCNCGNLFTDYGGP